MSEATSNKKNSRVLFHFRNVDMRLLVWAFFIISVFVRTWLNGYLKHAETYTDEWYYLQQAYAISNGNGLSSIYGQIFPTFRWLYSVLIAPACYVNNLYIRFYLIAFINSLILNSSIFPIWFIAKGLLHKRSTQVCALLIFVTLPELNIGASFMSDNAFFSLSTWMIWLTYQLVGWGKLSKSQKVLYPLFGSVLAVMSVLTKQAGILLIVLLVTGILSGALKCSQQRRKLRNDGYVSANVKKIKSVRFDQIIVASVLILVTIILLYIIAQKLNLLYRISVLLGEFAGKLVMGEFQTMISYHLLNLVLCFGVIPWPYIFLSLKDFSHDERFQFFLLILLTILCLIGAITGTFGSFEKGDCDITRFIARYFFFIFVPFMLFFLAAVERKREFGTSKLFIICVTAFCLVGFMLIWFLYPGNSFGSVTDHGILCWAMNFKANPAIAIILLHALVALFFTMIYHPRVFLPLFMAMWLVVQGYNNIISWNTYYRDYHTNPNDSIFSLRDFVTEHDEQNFILVGDVIPEDRSARYGDTYLDQGNIYRSSPIEFGSDWNVNSETRDPTLSNIPSYYRKFWWRYKLPFNEYNYFILSSSDSQVLSGDCTVIPFGEDTWYTLYKINDTHDLPTLLSLESIGPDGEEARTYNIPVNAGYFRAQRPDENGLPDFVSPDEPAYLCVGPYMNLKSDETDLPTLEPGFHIVTVRYEYDGPELTEGEEIGYVEFWGSDPEYLSQFLVPAYYGENETVVYLPVSDPIEKFEIRFFANVGGVRVSEVEIVSEP